MATMTMNGHFVDLEAAEMQAESRIRVENDNVFAADGAKRAIITFYAEGYKTKLYVVISAATEELFNACYNEATRRYIVEEVDMFPSE